VQLAWMIRSLLNAIKTSIVLDPFLLNWSKYSMYPHWNEHGREFMEPLRTSICI
jgi:hypothetical protein